MIRTPLLAILFLLWSLLQLNAAGALAGSSNQSVVTIKVEGQKLVGTFTQPKAKGKYPAVLLLHGMGGNRHGPKGLLAKTANYLAAHGISSLRISTRGRGGSQGDFTNMTFSRRVDEAEAAVRWMSKHNSINPSRITVLGHSQGSYVATATAALRGSIPKIRSVILWAPNANPRQSYRKSVGSKIYKYAMNAGKDELIRWRGVSGRQRQVRAGFFHDLVNIDHVAELRKYAGPVLIVTGRRDRWSPTIAARKFAKHHRGATSVWEINTGHAMGVNGSRENFSNFLERTRAWVMK